MHLPVAMLANAAEVRDGLLYVLGGGVRHVTADTFPAGLNPALAAIIEVDYLDQGEDHALVVEIVGEHGVAGSLMVEFAHQFPLGLEEAADLPFAHPLRGISVPGPGDYEVRLTLDGQLRATLPLAVGQV